MDQQLLNERMEFGYMVPHRPTLENSSVISACTAIAMLHAVLILVYGWNTIKPLNHWQHTERVALDAYQIQRINLTISLGLAGRTLLFFCGSRASGWRLERVLMDPMIQRSEELQYFLKNKYKKTAMGLCIMALIFILATIKNPDMWALILLWLAVPAFISISQGIFENYILRCLCVAGASQARALTTQTMDTPGGAAEWDSLVKNYWGLRGRLGSLWENFGLLLFASLLLNVGGSFLFCVLSSDMELAVGWRVAMVVFGMMLAINEGEKLWPLAEVTSICQSTDFRNDSQPKSLPQAAMLAGQKLGETEYALRFCRTVRAFPTGISFISGIHVSKTLLIQCSLSLMAHGSAVVYLTLHFVFGEHGVSHSK